MKFFPRLGWLRRVFAQQQTVATNLTAQSPEFIRWLGGVTAAGKSVTADSMMAVAAAWSCVRILAESVGTLPWSMYRRIDERNAEQAPEHWLQDLLVGSPNADQTGVEFRESMTLNLAGSGNAFAFRETAGARTTSLVPLDAGRVTPMRKLGVNTRLPLRDGAAFFRVNDRGRFEDFPREMVWHVKLFGRDALKGLSPLGAAREALGLSLAAEEFGSAFFRQGGLPAGTVSYPGWLTKDQREVAREALQKLVGGLGKAHQFALFEGGVKPEPWNVMNLEEMQFVLSRRFSVLEICRFFRVPPHMVAELEKGASYASIEQMSAEFVMYTLMPYLTRYEASVSKWLLPAAERGKYFLRFNVDALLRPTSKERAEFEAAMVDHGIMNRNEVRAKENLNRSEVKGMDDFTVQTALAPIDRLGQALAAPAPGPRAPAESQVRVNANIAMPERAAADLAASIVEGQRAHAAELTAYLERFAALVGAQRAAEAEGAARLAEQIEAATGKLAEQIDANAARLAEQADATAARLAEQAEAAARDAAARVAIAEDRVGAALEAVGAELEKLSSQEREITVGGETFRSKPVAPVKH